MSGFGGGGGPDLFQSVMTHSNKFSHVTSTEGAFAFNQAFEDPMLEAEATAPPTLKVEIIDAVQRADQDWSGLMQQKHIEYVIKLFISANKMKIVGKRFSELYEFHQLLTEKRLLDPSSPAFPDKNVLNQNWFKMDEKDVNSEFVKQRKESLHMYLGKLFEVNTGLAFDPIVMSFFDLEELGMEAALETSARTEAYNQRTAFNPDAMAAATISQPGQSLGAPDQATMQAAASASTDGASWSLPGVPPPVAPTEPSSSSNATLYDV